MAKKDIVSVPQTKATIINETDKQQQRQRGSGSGSCRDSDHDRRDSDLSLLSTKKRGGEEGTINVFSKNYLQVHNESLKITKNTLKYLLAFAKQSILLTTN